MDNDKRILFYHSGIGQRGNNEDNYSIVEDKENTLLVVCDGMGGAEKGEVASDLVCTSISESFALYKNNFGAESVEMLVRKAQQSLDHYIEDNPESRGMGTTLALAWYYKNKLLIAHCGDSKVIVWGENGLIHKTMDHSYVNELFKRGMIQESDLETHPKKNVITKALQGDKINKVKPEVQIIEDINTVALFLCSDGVVESFPEKELINNLLRMKEPNETFENIMNKCSSTSKDNYTAILFSKKCAYETSMWDSLKSLFN